MPSPRDDKAPRPAGRGAASRSRAGARASSGRGPAATSGRSAGARRTARPASKPARRAAERPTQVRRSSAQPTRATENAAARARLRARSLNSRAITLGALVIMCVLLLIIPVTNYLRQRDQIQQLQNAIAQKQASISQLKDQNELLDDPSYIKAQARDRLNYIEPGEKMYVVANNDPGSDAAGQRAAEEKAAKKQSTSAAEDLADSIAEADGPKK